MRKILLSAVLLSIGIMTVNAQLIKSDFLANYAVGDNLEKGSYANTTQGESTPLQANQWSLSGKTGENDQSSVSVSPKAASPLVFSGYVDSDKNVAIDFLKLATGGRTTIYSLVNDNTYGAGTYYFSFLFKVTEASLTTAAEFFSLDGNYTGNAQRVRFSVKGIDETTYQIGLGDSGAASTLSGTYEYGKTYVAVIEVVLAGDGTGSSSLYINPNLSSAKPSTASATSAITGTALKAIRGVVIRQRSTLAAQLSGLRFASTWSDVLGQGTSSIETGTVDKGEIISSKYYTLKGVEVKNPGQNTGVYIQKDTYENNSVVVSKVIK
ncbi:MAG: hypothetical protein ACK5MK_02220 [Dysgonomonas sp.]